MANVINIKPELIRWAVDRSGLSLVDFPDAVQEWISKKKQPTFSKLQAFAKKAMVPFGYLFLDQPPIEKLPIPDYRTMRDPAISPTSCRTGFDMNASRGATSPT